MNYRRFLHATLILVLVACKQSPPGTPAGVQTGEPMSQITLAAFTPGGDDPYIALLRQYN